MKIELSSEKFLVVEDVSLRNWNLFKKFLDDPEVDEGGIYFFLGNASSGVGIEVLISSEDYPFNILASFSNTSFGYARTKMVGDFSISYGFFKGLIGGHEDGFYESLPEFLLRFEESI